MAAYQIAYNPTTRIALIQEDGADVPEGSVNIGEFEYEPGDINVFFHHVRDALYHRKTDGTPGFWPQNETDMQRITIQGPEEEEPEPEPGEAPTNDEEPTIAGDAEIGATLTVTPGEWSGDPEPTLTYQWQTGDGENFTDLAGATGTTYEVQASDEGNHIRVRERATNTEGTEDAFSNSIGPIIEP